MTFVEEFFQFKKKESFISRIYTHYQAGLNSQLEKYSS